MKHGFKQRQQTINNIIITIINISSRALKEMKLTIQMILDDLKMNKKYMN